MLVHCAWVFYSLIGGPVRAAFLGLTAGRVLRPAWALAVLIGAVVLMPPLAGDVAAQGADKTPIGIEFSPASLEVREGNSITVTVSVPAGTNGSVSYRTKGEDTATAGEDYESIRGTLYLGTGADGDGNARALSHSFTIQTIWDLVPEPSTAPEVFILEFFGVEGELVLPQDLKSNFIKITHRPAPITVNYNAETGLANGDYGLELWDDGDTQAEKDRDKVSFRINAPAEAVSTSARSLMSYEISASTDPGKASAADYTITDKDGAALPASGSLQFPPNTTEQVIWVTPVDDLLVELPETFTLTLSNPQHGVEFPDLDGDGAADATIEVVGTIYSHDDVVEMHVDNVTVTEGKTAKLVATLDRALAEGESARAQAMVSDAGCRRRTTYPQPTPVLDYREVEPTQIIFGAGDQAKTFAIPTFDDFLDEPEECLGVEFGNFRGIKSVSNPTPQKGGQTLELGGFGIWASAFIADNDDPPALFVSPGEVDEPDDGETATLRYRVQLSNPSARTITVDYAEDSGSGQKDPATSGTDYTALTAGTLTFLPGEFRKTVDIEVTGDYDEEPEETVTLQFSDPVNACFPGAGNCPSGPITSTGIIHNDDQNLKLSFTLDDPTIVEGEDAVLRLTISHPIGYDVMAGVSTVDGTATAGSDFQAASRMGYSVRVPKGATEATQSVPVLADSVSEEGIEKFSFKLDTLLLFPEGTPLEETPPAVADQQKLKEIFGSGFAVADIRTNSPMPTASIVDGPALSVAAVKDTVTEGWPAQFEVTLDPPAATDVTFTWKTGDGGLDDGGSDAHKAKAGKDYTRTIATSVTIPAGETSVSLPEIPTLQDTVDEMDQQFMVVLESITGAVADEKRGVVTIRDDDSRPWISIADATVEEGGELSFTITLEGTSENEVSVLWVTEDDTATTLDHDYVGVERRRTVTFAPGEQTKTITVQTLEDRAPETAERFKVQLAHARHAKYRDPTAVGTITDNDLMEISIAAAAPVTEGSGAAAEFTVTLTPEQASPVTIQWRTEDGLGGGFYVAKSGGDAAQGLNDFTAVQSGSLTFAAGETEKTVSVTILDDTAYESIERFGVLVSGDETAMVIRNATAYGEIQDDDAVNLIMHQPLPAVVEEGETYVVKFKLPPRTEDDFWTVGRLGFINCYLDDYSFLGFPHPGTLLSEANVRDFALAHSKDGVSGEGKLDPANAGYYINYPCSGVAKQEGVTAHIFAEYVSTLEEHNFAVFVRINDDSISEDNEIASMWLIGHGGEFWSTMSPHLLWNGFALTTIIVDNDRPQASVRDVRVGEDAGNAILTISLSQASAKEVKVSYETRNGTAIAGQDYANQGGTVTFSPGETEKTISIQINADHLVEPLPETFTVALKDPSEGLNVHPVGGEATVTITDSTERTMTIPDRVVDEGEDVDILVKFSDPIAHGVGWFNRIALFFRDDGLSHPATANDDYEEFDGNLPSELIYLFDGDNRLAKTLTTKEDSAIETDEDIGVYARFTNQISQGIVYDSSRTSRITIRDDDHASLMIAGLDSAGDVTVKAGQVWTGPIPRVTGTPLGHVTWTLEGDDADDFSIDPDTGEVTLSDRDFEKPTDKDKNNIYSATVRATDEDGNTDTAAVQVTAGGRSLVLSKNSVTVAEKAGTDSFTVALDSQPTGDVTVALTTTGETGALTLDQTELTFKPGDWNQAQTVTVTGVDDKVDNADDKREASITLVASGRGFSATVEYTVAATVTDDDDRGITFSKKALTVAENGGTDSYTIVLDTQPTGDVTVTVRGVNTAPLLSVDTATLVFGPDDWDQPQTVTFTGGNDDLDNLKNPRYVITHRAQHADYEGFAAGSVTVTVTDDDVRGVTISKDAVEVNAGDTAEYTVVLNSQPHTGDGVVTIQLQVNPKARDTEDSQYISPTTLTFNSGNWNTPQTVTITGAKPSNLAFLYEITHQVSGADYTGVKAGTVQVVNRDEDHVATGDDLTVKSSSATEGHAVVFTVTRRNDAVPSFNWRTGSYDGLILPPLTAADDDSDYTPNSRSGNIVRFGGKDTVTFSVPTTDDNLDEVNEVFTVGIISYTGSQTFNHRYAVIGTIIDNDAAALSVAAPAVDEGEKAQVTISLSNPSINDVTVKWNTADDTRDDASPATAGTDYMAVTTAQTVTIKAGATSAVVEVQTTEDSAPEGDETFLLKLSEPTNAALPETAATAVVTITDNDGAPTVSVGDAAAVVEGDDPKTTVNLSFPVTLSAVSGQQVTVTYTLGGTATADDDYTDPATKSVAIAAGTRTANILIPVKGDVVDELNETVTVTLSGATNAAVSGVEGADEGEGTITDDDAAELSVADGSVAEGGLVSFTIGLDPVSDRTVTVKWSTAADAGGTHPAGAADYTAVSPARTATIAAGASSVVVTVQTTQDSLDEPDETFLLELSEPTNAALATGKDEATGTITDNDGAPTVSVGDAAAVVEGDDPKTTVNLSFPVTLSAVSGQQVTVTYTLGGTATADDDYTDPATKSVAIAAGTRTANILIPVKGDVVDELNETVTVTLSGATNAAVSGVEGADEGEGTITDDDAAELSVADGSVAEGGLVSFTIGLDPVSDRTVTVKWSTAADAGGTHPAGAADYTAVSPARTATIAAGASSVVVTVQTTQDSLDEPDETFLLELSEPTNAALATGKDEATGTITDNDGAPTVSVGDAAAVVEGDDPKTTVNLSFPVTLSAVSGQQVTVTYTLGGTATADDDYTDPATKSVAIAAGTRTANILIPVKGDVVDELNETVTVTLSGATNAAVSGVEGADEGEGTITDDDAAELSVADGSVAEGGLVSFTIGLDPVSDRTVTVKWSTAADAGGTHPAGAADYTAVSPARTATIAAGASSVVVTVQTTQDSLDEPDETFLLELSEPTNAALATGKDEATGTITDNDGAPTVSVGDAAAVVEGDDPKTTVNLSFPVTLSAVSGQQVTVTYTLGGTATADDDYTDPATKSVAIAAGTRTANILIPVKGDVVDELNETVTVTLSGATNAAVSGVEGADEGEGTITDDDAAELSVADGSVAEGGLVSFTIGLDPVSDRTVTVKWSTAADAGGTHPAGAADYTAVSPARTATIAAGASSVVVTVQTTQDSLDEPDETFLLELSEPTNAALATGKDEATGTITDNDGAPTVSVGDAAAVVEGDDPKTTVNLSFPVTLSAVSGQQVTVTYTLGGTATADDDYTDPATKSVAIAAGTRTANILIPVKGDVVDELNETVTVTLSGATNAAVSGVEGADEGEGTITDDDAAELSVADGSVAEGGLVSFTIGLDPVSDRTVTVKWSTAADAGGTHPAGAADYTAVSPARTATIAAGASSVVVTVQTTQDSLDEPDETFLLELSEPTNAALATGKDEATGTITDNDGAPTVSVGDAAAVVEGDDPKTTVNLSFPVTLSAVSGQQVTVTYTLGGTATADDDYTDPATKSVAIAAGTRTANILIPVKGDVVDELNETVTVTLSGATNAAVSGVEGADEGEGTITDDDAAELSVADGSVAEGGLVSFTIGLDPVSDRTVTVKWSTAADAGGTHPAGAADYTAVSPARTATIAAGASSVVVTVQTTQDSLDEPDETFLLELSEPTNAALATGKDEATGTITDNDGAPTVSVGDAAAVVEGDDPKTTVNLSFPVTLSAVSGQQVTVTYTLGGTATADDDYTDPATKSVAIAAGTRTANILIPVKGDVVDELNETVTVTLSGATNAAVSGVEGADEGEGTITDDDAAELSVADGSVAEGGLVSFTIGLDPVSDRTVTVKWSTAADAGGTHPAGAADYTAVSPARTATIAAGASSVVVTVQTTQDSLDEPDETFLLELSEPTNAALATGKDEATGTITDNDGAPTVSVGDAAAVVEGDDPKTTVNLSFPVTLSAVSGQQVTVTYTLGGTATADDDYTDPATKSVAIAAGTRTANILIPVKGDVVDELNETVTVTLSGATNAAVSGVEGADEGEGTITDDDAAELSVADGSVAEGGLVSFTIGLDPVSDRTVTVKWSTAADAGGTHPAGAADYTAVSPARTATIAAGASSVVVTVQTTQDSLDEPDETFLLELSEPTNAALATGKDEATGTITDNDGAPTVSVGDAAAVVEGDDPKTTVNLSFPVTLSAVSGQQVTVTYTLGGTATADDDYTDPATKSVAIAAGTRTANILIPVKGDVVDELNETVTVTLSGATNAAVSGVEGADEGEGTITDDDAAELSVADGSVAEGGLVSFTIGLDPVSDRTVTVKWSTAADAGGTHPAGAADYTAVSPARTATIAAGASSVVVTVQTTQDSLDEPDETFLLELSEPTNAALATGKDEATGTITDNDGAPTVSVGDAAAVVEGDDPKTTVNLSFPVTLSAVSGQQVTVTYTLGGTATADDDYTDPATKSVAIAAGTRTANILIPVKGDVVDELNETVTVTLSGATNAAVSGVEGADEGEGTITDDDAAELSVADGSVAEGGLVSFTIGLDPVSDRTVTVKWSTAADAGGTHPAGAADYTAVSPARTATIAAGASSVVVTVQTTQDSLDEPDETFLLELSEPTNAALATGKDEATGTITDNDGAPTVSVGDAAAVVEGDDPKTTVNLSFPVTLSAVSGQQVTVTYTLGGTATADDDYTDPATKSVAIAAGTRTANILIPVKGDVVDELNETVTVTLSGATNAAVSGVEGADEGEGTITDDDAAELSVADGSVAEGGLVSFTIGLDPVSDRTVTVKWSTAADAGGTHPAGAADYTAVSPARTATIAAGASSVVVTVQTTQDSLDEPDETFLLELSEPTNAALATGKDEATGTITDNDGAPTVSVGDAAAVVEGDDPKTTVNLSFPVTLSAVSGQQVTVTYTLGGTATADDDYTDPATKSVAIAAGTRTANILIPVKGDVVDELNETVTVTLSGATNAAVSGVEGADEGEGTITDDDAAELSVADGSVAEGGLVSFTIGLDPVSDRTVTVKWSTAADAGGTHPAGAADYTAVSPARTATIAAGASSVVVTVQTTQDSLDEPDETFLLELSEPTNAALATGKDEATGTITDNDGAPTVSVGDAAAVVEGDDPKTTVNLSFPVTLSAVSGQQVTVTYTLGGTATADDDYTDPATKSVAIAAGTRTANILIPVKGDVVDELNETVTVTLSGATNAAVSGVEGADEGEGTITDDDAAELSVADGSVAEGGLVSFTIGLDPVSDRTVTVKWSTAADAGGTHPAGAADYTAVSPARTATIAAGASSVVVTVQTTQDSLDEPDETFLLELSEPTNAALATGKDEATGTITDNDGAPTVSVGDAAAVVEGDDPKTTVNLSFPVTLSAVSGQQVTVTYTLGGTATADDDYTDPATKSVAIAAGTRTANILIPVKGDVVDELNETVTVTLSGATNAAVSGVEGADEGEGTITDDDAAELSVADGSVAEGGLVSFTIGLDPVSDRTVTVKWSTAADAGGTHPAGAADYTAVSPARTATIAAGASSVVVTVQTTQDSLDEPDETFLLELSEPTNAALATGKDEATGTITDNDGAPTVSVGDAAAVVEGDDPKTTVNLSFPVTLSAVSGQQVTVTYTLGGTATADDDYTDPATKSVAIAAGTRTANILIPVKGDVVDELNETVTVTLSGATNAAVSGVEGADEGEGTITDDDAAELSVADGSVAEGGLVSFTIGLDPVSDRTVTVKWSTAADAGGTHPAGAADYTAVSPARTATIAAGASSVVVTVQTTQDSLDEPDETFLLELSEPTNAALATGKDEATGTITDNDGAPTVSVGDAAAVVEGDDPKTTVNLSFPVTLSAVSGQQVTVTYTLGGTATADDDYTDPATKSVAIAAGTRTANILIPVKGDVVDELNETVTVTLSGATNAAVSGVEGADEGEGTITDDDAAELSVADGSVAEGGLVSFTIGLDPVSDRTVTVKWSTAADAGGTHPAGAADYTAVSPARTATIAAGASSVVVTVQTTQDSLDEPDETFLLELSEPTNAALATGKDEATGTITDNDGAPTVSVGDAAAVVEGDDPKTTVNLSFPVTLSAVSGQQVTVTYTLGGTATADDDYTDPATKSVAIAAGTRTANILIPVKGDVVDELNETVTVTLSGATNAAVSGVEGADEGEGTITDDDAAELSVADGSVAEGGLVSFTIGLDPVSDRTVTVKWSTAADAGGTHPAGAADYTAVSPARTATIAAGASSVVVTVQTTQDSLDEPDETFLLELSEPTNAALATGKDEATGTITDNDGAPTPKKAIIAPSPGSLREVVENVANAPTMTFIVSLSGTTFNTDQTVTVSVGKAGDPATSGVDYTAVSDWTDHSGGNRERPRKLHAGSHR